VRADYGYDILLSTYDSNGEVESGEIRIQVKATDELSILKDNSTISFRVSRSDLARWLHDPFPVILVMYDAQADKAYWLYVQRYFEALSGFSLFSAPNTVSVHIPMANLVNPSAIVNFSSYRENAIRQMPKGIHSDANSKEV